MPPCIIVMSLKYTVEAGLCLVGRFMQDVTDINNDHQLASTYFKSGPFLVSRSSLLTLFLFVSGKSWQNYRKKLLHIYTGSLASQSQTIIVLINFYFFPFHKRFFFSLFFPPHGRSQNFLNLLVSFHLFQCPWARLFNGGWHFISLPPLPSMSLPVC